MTVLSPDKQCHSTNKNLKILILTSRLDSSFLQLVLDSRRKGHCHFYAGSPTRVSIHSKEQEIYKQQLD